MRPPSSGRARRPLQHGKRLVGGPHGADATAGELAEDVVFVLRIEHAAQFGDDDDVESCLDAAEGGRGHAVRQLPAVDDEVLGARVSQDLLERPARCVGAFERAERGGVLALPNLVGDGRQKVRRGKARVELRLGGAGDAVTGKSPSEGAGASPDPAMCPGRCSGCQSWEVTTATTPGSFAARSVKSRMASTVRAAPDTGSPASGKSSAKVPWTSTAIRAVFGCSTTWGRLPVPSLSLRTPSRPRVMSPTTLYQLRLLDAALEALAITHQGLYPPGRRAVRDRFPRRRRGRTPRRWRAVVSAGPEWDPETGHGCAPGGSGVRRRGTATRSRRLAGTRGSPGGGTGCRHSRRGGSSRRCGGTPRRS